MTLCTDLGRVQLGSFVPLLFQAVDGNGLNAWPTATPTIKTFASDDVTTVVETIRPAARDPNRQTGLFMTMLRLSSSYTVDKIYVVSCSWAISGSTYRTTLLFRVVAGGNADGAVIGQTFVRRPEAGVVTWLEDGGKWKSARNPR